MKVPAAPVAASDVLPALSLLATHVFCNCAAFDFCLGDQQMSVRQTVAMEVDVGARQQPGRRSVSVSICCSPGMMSFRCAVLEQVGQRRGALRCSSLSARGRPRGQARVLSAPERPMMRLGQSARKRAQRNSLNDNTFIRHHCRQPCTPDSTESDEPGAARRVRQPATPTDHDRL